MGHALIIGGTRGLGREVVRLFCSLGYLVSVIGRREPPEIDKSISGARYRIADLADTKILKALIEDIAAKNGPLNYIVFCQRYRGNGDPWEGEIDISLTLTKLVVEGSQNHFERGGDNAIVLVSSVFADFIGESQAIGYHVGKAGLNQMMRYYAVTLGQKGIRVNSVTPFTFLKDESKDFYVQNEKLSNLYKEIIPVRRMGTTADSANLISFLCSPRSSFINGQSIYVDGGLSLVWPETLARKLLNT